jgi:hypothetical protein
MKESKEEIEGGDGEEKESEREEGKVGKDDEEKGEDAKVKAAEEEGAKVDPKGGGGKGEAEDAKTEREADT